MDELIHHCVRELSFDGDFGCNVDRLRDFVNGFHAREGSSLRQTVDDAYSAFVWSLVVQQPGVRIGILPPGAGGEVYIAPQPSAVKKAKTKGEEVSAQPAPPATFNVIPDATIRPLEELRQEYGDGLRIAVDPETTFAAITGSHIRPSKLTPMVYTALQLVTRGREEGISVVDLSKKSGYDPKTCHYLVDRVVELGLVVKRRRPGISTNLCVHTYFFQNSPVWQQVVKEEAEADETNKERKTMDAEQDADAGDDDGQENFSFAAVHFDPIDSRHLSSLPLVRARITKLLKASPHRLHAYQNLLVKIGFATPTRIDRRFFQARLRELIQNGVVEKVQVPHVNSQKFPDKKVICLHLLAPDEPPDVSGDTFLVTDVNVEDFADDDDDDRLKMNLTLHKQIMNLLDDAGTKGMTLNELCSALDNFDRRTIELLLSRLEKDPPPSHLGDLGIAQLGETHGRERRYKYYTVAHYRTVATKEKFEDKRYLDGHSVDVGGFLPVDESVFYRDEDALVKYVDDFPFGRDSTGDGKAKAKAKARPKVNKNPILADGSIKKGRPRKIPVTEGDARETKPSRRGTKRKRGGENDKDGTEANAGETEEPPPKRKRGRPPKHRPELEENANGGTLDDASRPAESPPKKRGRPSKNKPSVVDVEAGDGQVVSTSVKLPKKRGRLPKKPPQRSTSGVTAASISASEAGPSTSHPEQNPPLVSTSADNDISMQLAGDNFGPSGAGLSLQPPTLFPDEDVPNDSRRSDAFAEDIADGTPVRRSSRMPKVRSLDDGTPAQLRRPQRNTRSRDTITLPVISDGRNVDAVGKQVDMYGGISQTTGLQNDAAMSGMAGEQYEGFGGGKSFTTHSPHAFEVPFPTTSNTSDIPIDPLLVSEDELFSKTDEVTIPASPQGSLVLLDADATIMGDDIGMKRSNLDTAISEPPTKRAKLHEEQNQSEKGRRWKTNISQSRRENEILQVISEAGGIVNFNSKEFYDSHAALVESIIKAGEVASTRSGARLDKRTAQSTLEDLESRGKLKSVTTSVPTSTGNLRQVRVVYLADTSSEDLRTFLASYSFQHTIPHAIKVLEEPLTYGGGAKKSVWLDAPTSTIVLDHGKHQTKDPQLVQQLLQGDDNAVRDGLLTERSTVAQLYGFIVGKTARACELHLSTVRLFDRGDFSPYVVSADQRIIKMSYYFEELPVSTFCAVVSCLVNDENLYNLLQTAEGRQRPVGKVSLDIGLSLQLGRWRSRARILDLLDILQCLHLVIPLRPSTSDQPAIRCVSAQGLPDAFDFAPHQTWTLNTTPEYWQFKTTAPFHLWGLPGCPPPFWKDVPLRDFTECIQFWRELQDICLDVNKAQAIDCPDPSHGPAIEVTSLVTATAKALRRPSSWSTSYSLSWYQSEYLQQFVDKQDAQTPLQDDDDEARLAHISWVTSAPKEALRVFFEKARGKHLHEHEKAQKRAKKQKVAVKSQRTAKAALAERAAEAKRQRERDWDDMISHIQSDLLNGSAAVRVRRVRARYLQSTGKDRQKWEAEIAQAIQDATLAAKKLISSKIMPISPSFSMPPVILNSTERSVEDIIAQQGPRLSARSTKKSKNKTKADEDVVLEEPAERSRRQRFQWNRDYDELARDASVIIKARCRGSKMEWAAMEQVFPAVPRNSVRQRWVTLRETPGAEAYLTRLEERWYELWLQHRGTVLLPDPDPASATNFDLLAHVKFLRNHIDKNSLRVGFSEHDERVHTVLPATVDQIDLAWKVIDKKGVAPSWDFLWTYAAEEGREKQMTQQAFALEIDEMPTTASYPEDDMHVADSALKMTMGTPNESYDPQIASELLKSVGEEYVQAATNNLLARGILSKVNRDPQKSKPGRMLRISESNQNAIGGSISLDIFQDAVALEELLNQDEGAESWRDWPLLASDGDAAALVELVSENRVEFTVDTSQAQAARANIDWNSKKAADDDIETSIRVRLAESPDSIQPLPNAGDPTDAPVIDVQPIITGEGGTEHGKTLDGTQAYCRRSSSEVVDCQGCLRESTAALLAMFDPQKARVAQHVLNVLQDASSKGLTKDQLSAVVQLSGRDPVWAVVNDMTAAPVPLAYWTGYSCVVLVSSAYIRPWTVAVTLTDQGSKIIFPRRWVDISGRKMDDVWSAALRAVIGVILHRPGISQSEIYWRLRSVYDRQEVNDVLNCLLDEGLASNELLQSTNVHVLVPDDQESRAILWLVDDVKHWYEL